MKKLQATIPNKGDDSQRRFLAQHSFAMLEQCCNYSKQCRNNVSTLCRAKNRRWESSREHKCPLSKNPHIYTPTPHLHPRVYDIIYHALQGSCNFWVLINEIEIDVFSTKVLIEDNILSLLLETGPPFYVVIRATRSSGRLQG